jgi:hypothetical protein
MGYGKSKPGMFKMKHSGVPALMKALVGDQHKLPNHLKEAIKAAPEKSPAKKYGDKVLKKDPTDKKKATTTKSSNGLFDDMPAAERYKAMKAYKEADELTRSRMQKDYASKKLKDYEKTGGDEAYNQLQKSFRESKAKYKTQFGDPAEKGIGAKERLTRTEAINANAAKDVGMAYPRAGIKASPKTKETLGKYQAETERLGKIFDLAMQGRGYDKYKKQPTETAGAAPKKVGVGSKSIKQRIQEDAKKKKNAPKRATMTKKMYKK